MKESPRGIALLIILWVMTVLTVMAFSFTVMTRAESYGTLAFKEEMEKKLLAEAGIERGIMEIIYRSINRNQAVVLEGMEAWKLDGTAYTVDMGGGGCAVRIIDESGKISLNGLTDSSGIVLKKLLIQPGDSRANMPISSSIPSWTGRMPTICTASAAPNTIITCRSRNRTRPGIRTLRPWRN